MLVEGDWVGSALEAAGRNGSVVEKAGYFQSRTHFRQVDTFINGKPEETADICLF